jgi:hypothetical protein
MLLRVTRSSSRPTLARCRATRTASPNPMMSEQANK